jgi:hypothetical protein
MFRQTNQSTAGAGQLFLEPCWLVFRVYYGEMALKIIYVEERLDFYTNFYYERILLKSKLLLLVKLALNCFYFYISVYHFH